MSKEEEIRKEISALEKKMEELGERDQERVKMRKQTLKDLRFYLILFSCMLAVFFVTFLCISCSIEDLFGPGDERGDDVNNEMQIVSTYIAHEAKSLRNFCTEIEKVCFVTIEDESKIYIEDANGTHIFDYTFVEGDFIISDERVGDLAFGRILENGLEIFDRARFTIISFSKE